MSQKIDTRIRVMRTFAAQVAGAAPEVPAALNRHPRQACRGGMDECPKLTDVDVETTNAIKAFVLAVRQGLQAYSQLISQCANEYEALEDLTAQNFRDVMNKFPNV